MLQSLVISFFKFTFLYFCTMAKQEDIFKNVFRMQKSMDLFFRQAKFTMV
jgi:hypothetical protein